MAACCHVSSRTRSDQRASRLRLSVLRCRVRMLVAALTGRVRCARAANDMPVAVGTAPLARTEQARRAVVLVAYHAGNATASRTAIGGLVRAGYHLGPAPYGYRVTRVRMPAGAAPTGPQRRLVVDVRTGPVVTVIFGWRVGERLGYAAIAHRLAADPDRYPLPTHPRTGLPRPWTDRIVARVLSDPRYTGRQVWARTRGGRRMAPATWIRSGPFAHEPLVDPLTFALAQSDSPSVRRRGVRRPA